MELIEMYNTDKDFKRYVDRYCKSHNGGNGITVEEALEHAMVKNYAEYLKNRDKN